MKKVTIGLISIYQMTFSPLLKTVLGTQNTCRYEETCSWYAKRVIQEKGLVVGGWLSLKRLSSCHPFGRIAM